MLDTILPIIVSFPIVLYNVSLHSYVLRTYPAWRKAKEVCGCTWWCQHFLGSHSSRSGIGTEPLPHFLLMTMNEFNWNAVSTQ